MQKVYSTCNSMLAGYACELLKQEGIHALVRNQALWSGIGELPPNECWPEVWIVHDRDLARAREIIDGITAPGAPEEDAWTCTCGEIIEGQFAACWQCGATRTDP